jgi:hypothetical protein
LLKKVETEINPMVEMVRTTPMIGGFWNIRGLNKTDRVSCVADLIKQYNLDFIGIQETKEVIIDDGLVAAINKNMDWNYISTDGSAWGILVGFKALTFEVVSWQNFKFCATAIVKILIDKFTWRLIVVYGSPYDEQKLDFFLSYIWS